MKKTFCEFSEFAAEKIGIKIKGEAKHELAGAVGKVEEAMNAKTVSKKYKGIEAKTRTKGDGTGELKLSLHIDYEIYKKMYGMNSDTVKPGIAVYGSNSVHPEFSLTLLIEDEDGKKKVKAYPRCIVKEGNAGSIENGSDNVAEIDLTISVMPDDFGNGKYEALTSDLKAAGFTEDSWMENFTPETAQAEKVPAETQA